MIFTLIIILIIFTSNNLNLNQIKTISRGFGVRVWVSQQVKNRNDRVAEKNDLMIELDPEIAAAFGESANISSKFSSSKRIIL